jgi:hypothetical protein
MNFFVSSQHQAITEDDTIQLSTHQNPATAESCGATLLDLTHPATLRVCIGNIISQDQYVLPKGRRNIDETDVSGEMVCMMYDK